MGIYGSVISLVRERNPLVHHITNYVTVNDCANITLCLGASPVMAHAMGEVEEMVSMAGVLVLNIGTLDIQQINQMYKAGKAAEEYDVPIVFDPVGAGATKLRTETARDFIKELPISVIKGNPGEVGTLAGMQAKVRGVDSQGLTGDPVEITSKLAEELKCTVVMSGPTDIISDGNRVVLADNGHSMMGRISGTGCMAASVIGACLAVSSDMVNASSAGVIAFGIAGEHAAVDAKGPGTYKCHLFDAMAGVLPEVVDKEAKIRII